MNEKLTNTISVSYDGNRWHAVDSENSSVALAVTAAGELPKLPDNTAVSMLLLPVESLLSRTFSLPLSSTRFIDQEILAQELEEYTSEQAQEWWLAWQAAEDGSGVSGMMLGLPETLRQQIETDEKWRRVPCISADIWLRLNAVLSGSIETAGAEGLVAVFDADASGVFFGLWNTMGIIKNKGFWQGMRRLNWSENGCSEEHAEALAENIRRSLSAMGWQDEGSIALGRLPTALHEVLAISSWHGEVREFSELPARHDANLADLTVPPLNFRHGSWRASAQQGQMKPWYRSLALAAAVAVVWMAGMIWQNYELNSQLESEQQRIIDAFHKGLPDEKVLIDALAQLRKAAGGGAGEEQQSAATLWMQYLAGINRVYQQTPWEIRTLSFRDGKMAMSGQAKDLQTMNRIHAALQQETGKKVQLEDTDLSGSIVRFRMVWS